MGLLELTPDEDNNRGRYRQYPDHEMQDRIEDFMERSQEKFPGGVEIAFIEVSPEMTRTHGYFYHKPERDYIRLAEEVVEEYPWSYTKKVILHEMIHGWLRQNGYSQYSDGSGIFEWICGHVGADIDGTSPGREKYEIIEEFEKHEEGGYMTGEEVLE